MFSSNAPPKEDDEINIPTRSLYRGKRNPPGTSIPQYHHRACPPNGSSYVAPVIGINGTGSPVQIIQVSPKSTIFCLHNFIQESNLALRADGTPFGCGMNTLDRHSQLPPK